MQGPRNCFIPWSQVLSHTLVPGTAHTLVPGTASCPGSRYCLIPCLVPCTASFSGPKNMKIARVHNLTHIRAQNFSTTAPGPKFRDLQVFKNPSGPSQGPNWGPIRRTHLEAQSGFFWGPISGFSWAQGGGLLFSGGFIVYMFRFCLL